MCLYYYLSMSHIDTVTIDEYGWQHTCLYLCQWYSDYYIKSNLKQTCLFIIYWYVHITSVNTKAIPICYKLQVCSIFIYTYSNQHVYIYVCIQPSFSLNSTLQLNSVMRINECSINRFLYMQNDKFLYTYINKKRKILVSRYPKSTWMLYLDPF